MSLIDPGQIASDQSRFDSTANCEIGLNAVCFCILKTRKIARSQTHSRTRYRDFTFTALFYRSFTLFYRRPSGECRSTDEDENAFDEIGPFLRDMLYCKMLMPMFLFFFLLIENRRTSCITSRYPAVGLGMRLRDTVSNRYNKNARE